MEIYGGEVFFCEISFISVYRDEEVSGEFEISGLSSEYNGYGDYYY